MFKLSWAAPGTLRAVFYVVVTTVPRFLTLPRARRLCALVSSTFRSFELQRFDTPTETDSSFSSSMKLRRLCRLHVTMLRSGLSAPPHEVRALPEPSRSDVFPISSTASTPQLYSEQG